MTTRKRSKGARQVISVFPGLSMASQGPVVCVKGSVEAVFLRQSSIDDACGQHCLLMALVMLGVLRRQDVRQTRLDLVEGRIAQLIRRARSFHFVGTNTRELCGIAKLAGDELECVFSDTADDAIRKFTLDNLARNRLVILGMESAQDKFEHWALVVGVKGRHVGNQFESGVFLLLDPDVERPKRLPWNSTIDLDAARPRGRLRELRDLERERRWVALQGAVAIGWKQHEPETRIFARKVTSDK